MKPTKEEFRLLSNEEKNKVIESLDYRVDRDDIIELLSFCELETLNTKLLNELGRAYNNATEYETAITIFDMVPEQDRNEWWYYRYGFAYKGLAENLHHDFETNAKKALMMLDKSVELSEDEEIINNCVELVYWTRLKNVLESTEGKYPYIAKKYFEYKNMKEKEKTMRLEKKKIYKKITIEDIQNNDSWDICEPMWNTINIYDSYEDYIKSAEVFTLEQRYLLAITWYFAEVNNGGHHQFFYNSTGIVWEDVFNGFKHFGMNEYANNFQKVIEYCGGKIPFNRYERFEMLQRLEENEEEFFKVLDEADDFIFEYDGEENELNYIKAHPEKFIFEGEYEIY